MEYFVDNEHQTIPNVKPFVNLPQNQTFEEPLEFNLDYCNGDLYLYQNITRCAAILNFIYDKHLGYKNNVDEVFEDFLTIDDPIALFLNNLEYFFGLYIHSVLGYNTFKLKMLRVQQKYTEYPISIFCQGKIIFLLCRFDEIVHLLNRTQTLFLIYGCESGLLNVCTSQCSSMNVPSSVEEFRRNTEKKQKKDLSSSTVDALSYLGQDRSKLRKSVFCLDNSGQRVFRRQIYYNGKEGGPLNEDYEKAFYDGCLHSRPRQALSLTPTTSESEDRTPIVVPSQQAVRAALRLFNQEKINRQSNRKTIQANFKTIWSEANYKKLCQVASVAVIVQTSMKSVLATIFNSNIDQVPTIEVNIDKSIPSFLVQQQECKSSKTDSGVFNLSFAH